MTDNLHLSLHNQRVCDIEPVQGAHPLPVPTGTSVVWKILTLGNLHKPAAVVFQLFRKGYNGEGFGSKTHEGGIVHVIGLFAQCYHPIIGICTGIGMDGSNHRVSCICRIDSLHTLGALHLRHRHTVRVDG